MIHSMDNDSQSDSNEMVRILNSDCCKRDTACASNSTKESTCNEDDIAEHPNKPSIDLEGIMAQNKKLIEDNYVLEAKAKCVDALTNLLEASQKEAAELRRQKQDLLRRKLVSSQSGESEFGDMLSKFSAPPHDSRSRPTSQHLESPRNPSFEEGNISGLSCSSLWSSADAKNLEDIANALENLDVAFSQCRDYHNINEETAILEQLEYLQSTIPNSTSYVINENIDIKWLENLMTRFKGLKEKLSETINKKTNSLATMHEEIMRGKTEMKALQQRIGLPTATKAETTHGMLTTLDRDEQMIKMTSTKTQAENQNLGMEQTTHSKYRNPNVPVERKESADHSAELKQQVRKLESYTNELLSVNHSWDQQYKRLQSQMALELQKKDVEIASLRNASHTNVSWMLSEKEAIINELQNQMRTLQLEQQQPKQPTEVNDTDLAQQYEILNRRYSDQLRHCHILNEEKQALLIQNRQFRDELHRLSGIIEATTRAHTSPTASNAQADEIELYKEQMKCYENDFKVEKEEKDRIVKNLELANAEFRETIESLRNQLLERDSELAEKKKQMKNLITLQQQRSLIDRQLSAYSAEFSPSVNEEAEISSAASQSWFQGMGGRLRRQNQLQPEVTVEDISRTPRGRSPTNQPPTGVIERGASPNPLAHARTFPNEPRWDRMVPDQSNTNRFTLQ